MQERNLVKMVSLPARLSCPSVCLSTDTFAAIQQKTSHRHVIRHFSGKEILMQLNFLRTKNTG